MSKSKRQKSNHHYVPRFYLRLFTCDRFAVEPRRVNLYNIDSGSIIPGASIKDQCQKHLFYGDTDVLEEAFMNLEGVWASVLRRICSTRKLPPRGTEDRLLLLLFIGIQKSRTLKRAKEVDESFNMLYQNLYADVPDINISDYEIKATFPIIYSLRISDIATAALGDMKMQLLKKAAANTEFITSDDPVFSYNLYCEGAKGFGVTGMASTGLLVFLPLSPEFCLLLYDGKVYKAGKPGSSMPIDCSPEDVTTINALQFVGADSNLYFSGALPINYFRQMAQTYSGARREMGLRLVEAVDTEDPSVSLVHEYYNVPNLRLRLSFLSLRRDARRVPMTERINQVRTGVPKEVLAPHPDIEMPHVGNRARTFTPVKESSRHGTTHKT